ncbi:armadillo-type protein [Paraphysoderma sedebokerense]|nr:armadillo-type protein [Paraphysoderma sedebokerense]
MLTAHSSPPQSQKNRRPQKNPGPQRFSFKEKLLSKDKNTTPELIKRLKKVHQELSHLEQDNTDTSSLDKITRELVSHSLITHRDKGVKALTACCLADLLRLYAPDAPFSDNETKEIFELFVKQLANLSQIEGTYFQLYFYLLENLSTVKSVVLVADLPNADDLMTDFFRIFFDSIHADHSKNVYLCILDILQQLIEESNFLPQEVIEILLSQFYPKRQEENPVAYKLATDLCNQTTDRLQRYVCQYFTDIIIAAHKSSLSSSTSSFSSSKQKSADMQDFETTHLLIQQINRVAPGILLNVIPQIEEELSLDDFNIRSLATSILGEMFGEPNSTLAKRYPSVWKSWCTRKQDKNINIRITWLSFLPDLLKNHHANPMIVKEVNEGIKNKLMDPEEKVRMSACRVFGRFEFDGLLRYVDTEALKALGGRTKDKKGTVRVEAVRSLVRLWSSVCGVLLPPKNDTTQERDDDMAVDVEGKEDDSESMLTEEEVTEILTKFGWIPEAILNIVYLNDSELMTIVENSLIETIIHAPYIRPSDFGTRCTRLLYFLGCLEGPPFSTNNQGKDRETVKEEEREREKARKAFKSILHRQELTKKEVKKMLELGAEYQSNEPTEQTDIQQRLNHHLKYMANKLPDPAKSILHLSRFIKLNDAKCNKYLEECMDWEGKDVKGVRKVGKDFLKRLDSLASPIVETFAILTRRISPFIVSKEMIPSLIHRIKPPQKQKSKKNQKLKSSEFVTAELDGTQWTSKLSLASRNLLNVVSEIEPEMCVDFVDGFLDVVSSYMDGQDSSKAKERNEDENVTVALRVIAKLAMKREGKVKIDSLNLTVLEELCKSGSPVHAKYAAIILCFMENSQKAVNDYLDCLYLDSTPSGFSTLVTQLTVLTQIVKYKIDLFEKHSKGEEVIDMIVNELVLLDTNVCGESTGKKKEDWREWVDWCELEDGCRVKVKAIKVLVYRLISLAKFTTPLFSSSSEAIGSSGPDVDGAKEMLVACKEFAKPVLKLLGVCLSKNGDLTRSGDSLPKHASAVRLTAGKSVLRLAMNAVFEKMIHTELFMNVMKLVQDPVYQIRSSFTKKLITYLSAWKLHTRYISGIALVAHEPEEDIKHLVTNYLAKAVQVQKLQPKMSTTLELVLARIVYLLAQHPDFAANTDDLKLLSAYLEYYLDCIATKENVPLLYHIAGKLKTVQTVDDQQKLDENIYVLSDLTQFLLRQKCTANQWPLNSYPGDVKLPSDIFHKLNGTAAAVNLRKNWLPEDWNKTVEKEREVAKVMGKKKVGVAMKKKESSVKKVVGKRKTPGISRGRRKQESSDSEVSHDEEEEEEDNDEFEFPPGKSSRSNTPSTSRKRKSKTPESPPAKKRKSREQTPQELPTIDADEDNVFESGKGKAKGNARGKGKSSTIPTPNSKFISTQDDGEDEDEDVKSKLLTTKNKCGRPKKSESIENTISQDSVDSMPSRTLRRRK